jgi:Ca2+-binding EF-hand superfamily protein
MSEPAAALEQRINQLELRTARHAVAQTVAVVGLAAAGVGVAFALNAPALPVYSRASSVLAVQPIGPPTLPALEPSALSLSVTEAVTMPEVKSSSVSKANSSKPSENTEASMNKSKSIAVAAAVLGATVAAQAQTPNGAATQTAAATSTQSAGQAANSRPRISPEQIVALNDLDKDGVVTMEEAKQVNTNLFVMWPAYDMDHDGKVDAAEINRATYEMFEGTALERITGDSGGQMALQDPAKIIANNDLNGDGIVTKEEATQAGKALIRMWDSYDRDKDGKVDATEVRKAQPY